jgi:hypothetical protein
MKSNTIDEMIAVLEAYRAGEKIQYLRSDGVWEQCVEPPNFNFGSDTYRTKPKEPEVILKGSVLKKFVEVID